MATNSPGAIAAETPVSAIRSPKRRPTPWSVTVGEVSLRIASRGYVGDFAGR